MKLTRTAVCVLVAGLWCGNMFAEVVNQSDGSKAPKDVAPGVWAKIAPQLKAARYGFEATADGVFKAHNPAHDFEIVADVAGVHVKDSVVLRGIALLDVVLPQDVRPEALGSRVEYRRANVIEWFENKEEGLEQGFTINEPAGKSELSELQLLVDVAGARSVTVKADGQSARITDGTGRDFGYGGLKAWDATGHELSCRMESITSVRSLQPSASLLIVCDARAAVYPVTIDPVLTSMEKKLTASDRVSGDIFGYSVSVAGDVAVVGAYAKDSYLGAAYVFERDAGGINAWAQVKKLTASDGAGDDSFGYSVSVAGDVILVGARLCDTHKGAAYVFERNAGGTSAWGEVKIITASDGAANDYFGCSVSVAGDVALVGASGDDNAKGSVYVYERNLGGTNTWRQAKKLTASDGAANDYFGFSVSVAGDVALVGIFRGAASAGAAYVFERNLNGTNAWGQVTKLTAADGVNNDLFGSSVSVAGDVALVGAYGDDFEKGSAYIFERNAGGTNGWGQVNKLVASDGTNDDLFGSSVSVAGDVAVVGAYAKDSSLGAAYVFGRNVGGTNAWGQVSKLAASNGTNNDQFGFSVGVSEGMMLVGAYSADSSLGAAYLIPYRYAGWNQAKNLMAVDGVDGDSFGASVSIAGDVALIGAGAAGNYSGSAFVFERNACGTNGWGLVKKLLAPNGAEWDSFGCSVSVAGDVALVGSYGDDDLGDDSGSAYVFERNAGGTNGWGLVKKLLASDGVERDYFGSAVSVAGDVALVGAYGVDDVGGIYFGSAYVFERNAGGTNMWGQVKKLTASDAANGDSFGMSVSVAGDVALVGAPYDDDMGNDSGAAYAFERNAGGTNDWGEVAKLLASDGAASDFFGYAVSVAGDVALVGAFQDDDHGDNSGSAYVFERNAGSTNGWVQVKKLLASDGVAEDYFGWSVSVGGDVALVGAYGDDNLGGNSGSAYVFERNAGGTNMWGLAKQLLASNGSVNDQFGYSVSVAGDVTLVGARYGNGFAGDSGSAYVFEGLLCSPSRIAVLLQNTGGAAGRWFLGPDGKPAEWQTISGATAPWLLRDMDDSRVLLQQGDGGQSGIWTLDEYGKPATWKQIKGSTPGWIMRSLAGNRVLLQQGNGGQAGIWTLGTNGTPVAWIQVCATKPGWILRSLDGDRILLQKGDGGQAGIWQLNPNGTVASWKPIRNNMTGLISRSLDGNQVLIQMGAGGRSGVWTLEEQSDHWLPVLWTPMSDAKPGWILRALD